MIRPERLLNWTMIQQFQHLFGRGKRRRKSSLAIRRRPTPVCRKIYLIIFKLRRSPKPRNRPQSLIPLYPKSPGRVCLPRKPLLDANRMENHASDCSRRRRASTSDGSSGCVQGHWVRVGTRSAERNGGALPSSGLVIGRQPMMETGEKAETWGSTRHAEQG